MFKYTVSHVCCVSWRSLVASSCQVLMLYCSTRQRRSLSTVCMCEVSLRTYMNSASASAFIHMETEQQKYCRNYQFICLCFHGSSRCFHLISSPPHMVSRSLGLLKGTGLTCQMSGFCRMSGSSMYSMMHNPNPMLLKTPMLCWFSGSYFYFGSPLENVHILTSIHKCFLPLTLYSLLLQHLYSPSF